MTNSNIMYFNRMLEENLIPLIRGSDDLLWQDDFSYYRKNFMADSVDGVHFTEDTYIQAARVSLENAARGYIIDNNKAVTDPPQLHYLTKRDNQSKAREEPQNEDWVLRQLAIPPIPDTGNPWGDPSPCNEVSCLTIAQLTLGISYLFFIICLVFIKFARYINPSLLSSFMERDRSGSSWLVLQLCEHVKALIKHEKAAESWTLLGLFMFMMWLIDGPNHVLFTWSERVYDRDLFFFILFVILIGCLGKIGTSTPRKLKPHESQFLKIHTPPRIQKPKQAKSDPVIDIEMQQPKQKDLGVGMKAKEEIVIDVEQEKEQQAGVHLASNIVNREQTEEWKGWMQIMFLMYHYFHAVETYNAIRIFIACYVWMTGFGHFSYFWVRESFSFVRLAKMLFRLNFLVVPMAITLQKEWMEYYICPMHTLFFLCVYICMGVGWQFNKAPMVMKFKICLTLAIAYFFWDFHSGWLFSLFWYPFEWLVAFRGSLHEFYFRTWLDHYAWVFGMICAYFYPNVEAWVLWLERTRSKTENIAIKGTVLSITLAVFVAWWKYLLAIPNKFEYNSYHPYTSFIPITCYIIFRNIHPYLRVKHLVYLQW
eukprot:CAMPEP_0174267136 /NCGR_PEP_ID=MMETSP0439-20130205/32597_1 /TAXON_ID=0 /ORGANISM="Stereomyxa ramosa, Strain Chinc5" /LENGTH=593 /DNA_ID=CAMNT_0015354473 /DNA_START=625 /DNA_END=2403 /DNA_ORIENTATION=+